MDPLAWLNYSPNDPGRIGLRIPPENGILGMCDFCQFGSRDTFRLAGTNYKELPCKVRSTTYGAVGHRAFPGVEQRWALPGYCLGP